MREADDPTTDISTRQLLETEAEKHRAALEAAKDDYEAMVVCTQYIRRISQILRNAPRGDGA